MSYDSIVIGAGVSGLATAIILARNGQRVALVEAAPRTAPVLRGFSRRGVCFDTGFHYAGGLQEDGPLDILLRYLGLSPRLRMRALDPQGFDVLTCGDPGFTFRLPYGDRRVREALNDAFPREHAAIAAFLDEIGRICSNLPYLNLDASPHMEALENRRGVTLAGFLDTITTDRALQTVLSFHCLLHGASPDEVPLVLHAGVVGPYLQSAHGLVGGGRALAEAFDAVLADVGVDVRCGHGVREILCLPSGTVRGVRLHNGEELSCRTCVSTTHPASLVDLVPAGVLRPAYVRRVRELEETPSAFILYGVTGESLHELEQSNRYFFPSAGPEVFRREIPLEQRPLYVTAAWTEDREPAARGFVALCPTPAHAVAGGDELDREARSADYGRLKAEATDALRAHLERWWPGIGTRITHLESSTPLTLRKWAGSPYGSLYGIKHSVSQVGPTVKTRAQGLYLAGQAVLAPGIMGCVISAFLACGAILGHERFRRELRGT